MALVKNVGQLCPVCEVEGHKADYRALQPRVEGDKVVEPSAYGVCFGCMKTQWYEVYGKGLGMDYDTYLFEKMKKYDETGKRLA